MKLSQWRRWTGAGGLAAAMWILTGCGGSPGDDAQTMAEYQAQLDAEAAARAKDPAWTPSHHEVAVIKVGNAGERTLNNFCLDAEGNVLACIGGATNPAAHALEVYSPDGKLLQKWPLAAEPQAICRDREGTVIVAGGGQVARLDRAGKVLVSARTPTVDQELPPDADLAELAKRFGTGTPEARLQELKTFLAGRRSEVTGVAVAGDDVFLACPSTKDYSYAVYRTDREFKQPKLIISQLSGCCGQMDIQAREGKVWVAHNARHRVQSFDRDGKSLTSFGREDRKAADGFGGCCEPKNLRLLASDEVLAGESGPPVAIKRFSAEGRFLGVVAVPTFSQGCVRTTVDVSADGKRYYILNVEERAIHVFAAKG